MLPPKALVCRETFIERPAFRLSCVVLPVVVFCVLVTSMRVTSVWAGLEPASAPDIQPEDRALDIESGVTYGAGTRLKIPGTDWSFIVPVLWRSSRQEDSDMPFLMAEEGKGLGMMFPLADATREVVHDHLSQPLSLLHGLSFIPAGAEVETETSIARSYQGDGMIGRALAKLGPGGAGVIYFIMGPPEGTHGFESVLERLGQSTRFTEGNPSQ